MTPLLIDVLRASTLPLQEVAKLGASCQIKTFKKGQNILCEAELCKHIYFLEKGSAKKYNYKDGKLINLDFFFEGCFFTNLKSLREGSRSAYSISANENSIIAAFPAKVMLDLYQEYPAIETFGRDIVARLMWEQEEHTDFLKLNSPFERYQHLLSKRPELFQRISISQLASYLGTSRETLCRIRKIT